MFFFVCLRVPRGSCFCVFTNRTKCDEGNVPSFRCGTRKTATIHELTSALARYPLCMNLRLGSVVLALMWAPFAQAQYEYDDSTTPEAPQFETYALASGLGTVDATPTIIIHNPAPGQRLNVTPTGVASGARGGFVWRYANIGLMADLGFHRYSDSSGSTTLAPLMLGLRFYSEERFRTSFFAEGLSGAYRWTERSPIGNFTTVKGIVAIGGGMDIRLSQRLVWRVLEVQIAIAGARNGPALTGGPSTGLAYRLGSK